MPDSDKFLDQSQLQTVLRKDLENILKKSAAGKTLSKDERAALYAYGQQEGDQEQKPTTLAKNKVELAQALGVSRRTISDHEKKHPDAVPKPKPNGFHDVLAWRLYLVQCGSLKEDMGEGLSERQKLEAQKLQIQCRLLELSLKEAEGSVVDRQEYERDLLALATLFKSGIEGIPKTFAAKLRDNAITAEAEKISVELLERMQGEVERMKAA